MDEGQPFWAFISYSHKDAAWAAWLQRSLERYVAPRRLVGRETAAGRPAPRRFRPVFRDRGDLAADPDLKRSVAQVLARCAFLIVVCSPAAAASPWVEDEIVQFKRLHGEARILAVIVAGEPNVAEHARRDADECFPRALRRRLDETGEVGLTVAEPVAADLRPGGDGRRRALLKLLAGMLGVGLDELIHRDTQRRVAQLTAMTAGALAAAVVMGALTLLAVGERNDAQRRQSQAEGLIEFMLGDLKNKLEPAGRLDALDAVGRKAMAYYAAQKVGDLDADSLGRRARVLHLMGEVRETEGDFAGALALLRQASASTAELLARQPSDPQRVFDHAQSVYWVGNVAEHRGEFADAEHQFSEYQRLARRLIALDPKNQDWRAELGYADTALGDVLLKEHRVVPAAQAFTDAVAIFQARSDIAPGDRDHLFDLAQGHAYLADAEFAQGRVDAALRQRLAERSIYDAILARAPDYRFAAYSETVNERQVAALYLASGKPKPAEAESSAAAAGIEKLMIAAPDAVDYRGVASSIYVMRGRTLLGEGRLEAAQQAADRALGLAEGLVRQDPTDAKWQGKHLGSARVLEIQIAETRARGIAARRQALEPAIGEAARLARLADADPQDWETAQVTAAADLLAGDAQALSGRVAAAHLAWSDGLRRLGVGRTGPFVPLDPDNRSVMVRLQERLEAAVSTRTQSDARPR